MDVGNHLMGRVLSGGVAFAGKGFEIVVRPLTRAGVRPDGESSEASAGPTCRRALDGEGHIAPLYVPDGELELTLTTRVENPVFLTAPRGSVRLGTVRAKPHETVTVDIELGAKTPWSVRRTVLVNGKPVSGVVVIAYQGPPTDPNDVVRSKSDADGAVSLGPLLMDDYKLIVRPLTGGWTCELPRIDRKAAADGKGTLEIQLVEGALQILDAKSGKPLPNRKIGIVSTLPFNLGMFGKTDAKGRVTLSLSKAGTRSWITARSPSPPG